MFTVENTRFGQTVVHYEDFKKNQIFFKFLKVSQYCPCLIHFRCFLNHFNIHCAYKYTIGCCRMHTKLSNRQILLGQRIYTDNTLSLGLEFDKISSNFFYVIRTSTSLNIWFLFHISLPFFYF